MSQTKAIIFDADGTLLDTFEIIVSAYRHVSKSHNLPVPTPADIRKRLGSPMWEMFQAFYPGQDIEPLLKTNNEFVAANVLKSEAFAGVQELLEDLQSREIKLGILTSGSASMLDILEHHGLRHYFASMVYAERVERPKPDPEGFILACLECGVEPNEAIMVGDTVFDIKTGRNAGAQATIAITHGYGTAADLAAAKPDYTVRTIFELQKIVSKFL